MAKKKYYAVNYPIQQVFETWSECQAVVSGVSSARFKSFKTREEADDFAHGTDEIAPPPTPKQPEADQPSITSGARYMNDVAGDPDDPPPWE